MREWDDWGDDEIPVHKRPPHEQARWWALQASRQRRRHRAILTPSEERDRRNDWRDQRRYEGVY